MKITRIALTSKDGTVEEFTMGDNFHFILGFAKCGPDGGKNVPAEIIAVGSTVVLGEVFYLIGETHPELLDICARKSLAKALKARDIDPGAEAFKAAPVVGGVQ